MHRRVFPVRIDPTKHNLLHAWEGRRIVGELAQAPQKGCPDPVSLGLRVCIVGQAFVRRGQGNYDDLWSMAAERGLQRPLR